MTTCVVVRKGDEVAIAADALVTFGDTRLSRAYERNQKVIPVGDSFVGWRAPPRISRSCAPADGHGRRMPPDTRDDVFRTFLKVHEKLKNEYFINTKEDEDDPYESSQIVCLIANPGGIFGVYSYREVFSFDRFWGIGSGRNYALGAMHAVYDRPDLDAGRLRESAWKRVSSSTRVRRHRSTCTRYGCAQPTKTARPDPKAGRARIPGGRT
jgi:ATP-dependent HslUV protease subunit HslV